MSEPGRHSVAASGVAGSGAPLEAGIRDNLATSYRHDFSSVRVHTGPEADHAARSLGAQAYAVGNDVVFANRVYDPLSNHGRAVIAHELAHVAQHGGEAAAPSFLRSNPTAVVPAADQRLERQADVAASMAGVGLPRGWAWERSVRPFLGKVDVSWTPLIASDYYRVPFAGGDREIRQEQTSPDAPQTVRINMGEFVVPASKGPWLERYGAVARAGGLQAILDVSGGALSAALWEQRADPDELRRLWLTRVQWPRANANQWWEEAGGQPITGDFRPATTAGTAQIDHIVELQLGGSNVPDNLAPHTASDNRTSGTVIWGNLRQAAAAAAPAVRRRHPGVRNIALWFGSARQDGAYDNVDALPVLPRDISAQAAAIAQRRGRAIKALQVHNTALADLRAGVRPAGAAAGAAGAATGAPTEQLQDYPISAGPSQQVLRVPATPPAFDPIEGSSVAVNNAARELIPGIVLEKLTRPQRRGGAAPHVIGWVNSPDHPVRSGTRLPIDLRDAGSQRLEFEVKEPGAAGRLKLVGEPKTVAFTYPYLSPGTLTLRTTPQGLVGRGTIRPSIALLSRVQINVDFDRDGLRGSVDIPKDRLALPPFRVTDAALALNIAPSLSAQGRIAFVLGTFMSGQLDAGVDATGLYARGQVEAHVPGLDSATGQLEYRPATGLSGAVVVHATRAGGLVRGGEVRVELARGDWTASGALDLMLPGDNPAQLSVRRSGARIVYGGRARLTVPGLRPVDVDLTYDGEHLNGSARTTFTLLGANGTLDLRYRDGHFSGTGGIDIQRGKFAGHIDATLDEHGNISGRGTGRYEIRPGLVGTVGIEYGANHQLRVSGELRFPPYRFLEPRGDRRTLFERNLPSIPLFAIPLGIGNIGVVAVIGGGLAVHYQFGPGEIRDMVIRAALNPLDEDMNAEIAAEARLVIPAEAGLELSVRAGIGLELAIANVTGGITVTGGVLLRGGLDAAARLSYARGLLTFDARAAITVAPVLTLRIEADIQVDASVAGHWRWPYELASYSYNPGLQFGMIAPFHYQSDQPLRLPSFSDIQWVVPDINVRALTDRIASQVRAAINV